MKRSRSATKQIVRFPKEVEASVALRDLCRNHRFCKSSHYIWKAKYGAKGVSNLQRLQELEEENLQLKEMFADLSLEYRIPNDVVERKLDGVLAASLVVSHSFFD